jgi:flagellar basal body-associated protein FliL
MTASQPQNKMKHSFEIYLAIALLIHHAAYILASL